ncbi:MAG: hypothetical protein KC414_15275, partial [Romboutsia sp.]|nr:hypothetical protein [Romboutsia sp.]
MPKVYSSNKIVLDIANRKRYKSYLIQNGFLQSILQLFRNIKVLSQSIKTKLYLDVGNNEEILIDIYHLEPKNYDSCDNKSNKDAHDIRCTHNTRCDYIDDKESNFGFIEYLKRIRSFFLKLVGVLKGNLFRLKMRLTNNILVEGNVFSILSGIVLYRKIFLSDLSFLTSFFIRNPPSGNHISHDFLVINDDFSKMLSKAQESMNNILLIHGLNGSSNSTYIRGMTNVFLRRNCRVFCLNARGSLIPPKSNNFNHIGFTSDLKIATEYILNNFKGSL